MINSLNINKHIMAISAKKFVLLLHKTYNTHFAVQITVKS